MLLIKIAFRNIFRQRRRSLLTALTMAGGYILLSLSIGISDGSYSHIIDIFTRDHTGHLQVYYGDYLDKPSIYKNLPLSDAFEKSLLDFKEVRAVSPRVLGQALAFGKNKTSPASIVGIDLKKESSLTHLSKKLKEGAFFNKRINKDGYYEALIGVKIAEILKIGVRDEIVLISQGADGSIANDQYIVSGIIGSKDSYEAMKVFIPIVAAQTFFSMPGRIHTYALTIDHFNDAEKVAKEIERHLNRENYSVTPWQVIEQDFYNAMRTDVKGSYVSLAIIMFIVSLGVLNTVLMALLERTREYGVLKALGSRPGFLFRLIALETLLLSCLSVFIGVFFAVALNYWFATHGIMLSAPVDMGGILMDRMLSEISFRSIIVPGIVTIASAMTVCLWPAWRMTRINVVDALRSC